MPTPNKQKKSYFSKENAYRLVALAMAIIMVLATVASVIFYFLA